MPTKSMQYFPCDNSFHYVSCHKKSPAFIAAARPAAELGAARQKELLGGKPSTTPLIVCQHKARRAKKLPSSVVLLAQHHFCLQQCKQASNVM